MSVPGSHNDQVRLLRERAERYRVLAEGVYDPRTAAEVAGFVEELEAEATRLEHWQSAHIPGFAGNAAFALDTP
jgi:hypothetical protein